MKKILNLLFCLFFIFLINVSLCLAKQKDFIEGKNLVSIISDNSNVFSPNNDSFYDTIVFRISLLKEKSKLKNWKFNIVNAQTDDVVYSTSGKKEIPDKIIWDGKDKKGNIIEGEYKYIFTGVVDGKNIKQEGDVFLDLTDPFVSFLLVPDTVLLDTKKNKLVNDVMFMFNIGDETGIDKSKTKIQIYSYKNKIIKEFNFAWFDEIPDFITWDGKDDNYDLMIPPGDYKVVFTVTDSGNNRSSVYSSITVFEQVPGKLSDIIVKEDPRGLVINLSSNNLFASNRAVLKKEARESLNEAINLIKEYPKNKILIEAYTDSIGDKDNNLKLSYSRAKAVYSYFVKNGINSKRLSFVGYGEEKPIASNKTANGRAQNRRIKIIVLNAKNKK